MALFPSAAVGLVTLTAIVTQFQTVSWPTESPSFVTVAEAWTSDGVQPGIEAAYRMFTVRFLNDVCPKATPVSRLVTPAKPISLRVGKRFRLRDLTIRALGESGRPVQRVPIALEVEEKEPPLIRLRSDLLADGTVMPIRTGRFRFRARAICPTGALVMAIIEAAIHND